MILYHSFTDKLASFNSSLIDNDLVMFSKLNFIVLNRFIQILIAIISLFNVVNDLEKIDGNWKYLSTSLENFSIFFTFFSVFLFKLNLVFTFVWRTFQHLIKFGLSLFYSLWRSLDISKNYLSFEFFFKKLKWAIKFPVFEILANIVKNFLLLRFSHNLNFLSKVKSYIKCLQ